MAVFLYRHSKFSFEYQSVQLSGSLFPQKIGISEYSPTP
ncbi:hypothetical protein FM106_19270 [Brachybacterium faecium]|nr:hypothetical protein FM106_19270 [Brachybacterium faecium]